MAAISPDVANLDPLYDAFITALVAAAQADAALLGAVGNVAAARQAAQTAADNARVAYNAFLRRIGTGSMTAGQRAAFRRVFGDLDDLNPAELGGAVRRAAEGG